MYSLVVVIVAVIAISAADPITIPQECPKPPSAANATFADYTGALQYVKYYKSVKIDYDLDGVAYRFNRQGNSNSYTITVITVYYGGKKEEETFKWFEEPAENTVGISKNEEKDSFIYYSIPYLDENKTSILYLCGNLDNKVRKITQILTPNMDNDLTKALEEAKKIAGSDLTELPYKFKNAFTA